MQNVKMLFRGLNMKQSVPMMVIRVIYGNQLAIFIVAGGLFTIAVRPRVIYAVGGCLPELV
jgi:hypothetical protein